MKIELYGGVLDFLGSGVPEPCWGSFRLVPPRSRGGLSSPNVGELHTLADMVVARMGLMTIVDSHHD